MTVVVGSLDNVLFEILKVVGIHQDNERVHVKPQIGNIRTSAATKKRKYQKVTMDFKFDSSCFARPEGISALMNSSYSVYFGFPPEEVTPETMALGNDTSETYAQLLDKYPELQQLWADFLPKWKAAYARALEGSDSGGSDRE